MVLNWHESIGFFVASILTIVACRMFWTRSLGGALMIGGWLSFVFCFMSVFLTTGLAATNSVSDWLDAGWIQVVNRKTRGSMMFWFPSMFFAWLSGCTVSASLFGLIHLVRLVLGDATDSLAYPTSGSKRVSLTGILGLITQSAILFFLVYYLNTRRG